MTNTNNKNYTAQDAINSIREHFDYNEYNYIQNFTDALEDPENISEYIDYVSSEQYRGSHYKSKQDYLFEDTYFNKQLEQIADIMLDDYDNQNGEYADYTLLTDYAIERDERNLAIETNVDSDAIERGLAIHVDVLDSIDAEQTLELSDRVRRVKRYEDVRANLDNYPDLKQMYESWEQMGLTYGFHESYTKEEKEAIRDKWLKKFAEDVNNPYTPKNRMRLLRKNYNELGYDMHLALEQLRNPIYSNNSNHHVDYTGKNHAVDLLEETFSLYDYEHVVALLEIQKESRKARVIGMDRVQHVNDWYPVLSMLEAKYKVSHKAGGMGTVLYDFFMAVKFADLEDYQREIINLIRQHESYLKTLEHEWIDKMLIDPYRMIRAYIKDKYDIELDMRQLRAEIRNIAKEISAVHSDLKNDLDEKECVSCKQDKMPSAFYAGRNECKKCYKSGRKVG